MCASTYPVKLIDNLRAEIKHYKDAAYELAASEGKLKDEIDALKKEIEQLKNCVDDLSYEVSYLNEHCVRNHEFD